MIKTARIFDNVIGVKIDITVKNAPNHVLAPTWEMVMSFKKGKISWEEYSIMYIDLLRERYKTRKKKFIEIIEKSKKEDIYLCCFCVEETQCHRSIAKDILEKISKTLI